MLYSIPFSAGRERMKPCSAAESGPHSALKCRWLSLHSSGLLHVNLDDSGWISAPRVLTVAQAWPETGSSEILQRHQYHLVPSGETAINGLVKVYTWSLHSKYGCHLGNALTERQHWYAELYCVKLFFPCLLEQVFQWRCFFIIRRTLNIGNTWWIYRILFRILFLIKF